MATLFTHPAAQLPDTALASEEESESVDVNGHFDLQPFDAAERAILSERARNIARSATPAEPAGTEALAIIRLSGETFGIRLGSIREFAVARRIMPLPSCPGHIAGSINLRGEVLMLLDLHTALHLASPHKQDKVVVMTTPEIGLFGVLVDHIEQVVRVRVEDPSRLPAGLGKFEDSYLNGLAHWGETDIPVLDIPALLVNGSLIVNEAL